MHNHNWIAIIKCQITQLDIEPQIIYKDGNSLYFVTVLLWHSNPTGSFFPLQIWVTGLLDAHRDVQQDSYHMKQTQEHLRSVSASDSVRSWQFDDDRTPLSCIHLLVGLHTSSAYFLL